MQVVTFYSYKGGTGRTLACANYGLYLAKIGKRVILADMDFEAPGLDSKFPSLEVPSGCVGLIDQFLAYQSGDVPPELSALEVCLSSDVAESGGSLRLIPAGNYLGADYFTKLSGIRWESFLTEERGMGFCLDLVRRIEADLECDVLVIDSRTGLTEVAGLCTQILPDTVILLTSTSRESMLGTRRIFDRIKNSAIVKSRLGNRTALDLRVVIARTSRPKNLKQFEARMKDELGLDIERLYYLFDQSDLSLQEYLALDRFHDHPPILQDYVELFASFSPDITLPYVEERLRKFRSGLTLRPPAENDFLIQEILTLFPRAEVVLEAARYYRLAKDGDPKAVENYLRYMNLMPEDSDVLAEFALLCASVPEGELKPAEAITNLLERFGIEKMPAHLLARYANLARSQDAAGAIVRYFDEHSDKLLDRGFRATYLKALFEMGEWEKVISSASESDHQVPILIPTLAESYASVGRIEEALKLYRSRPIENPSALSKVLRIIYRTKPDIEPALLFDGLGRNSLYLAHIGSGAFEGTKSDKGFTRWIEQLRKRMHQ